MKKKHLIISLDPGKNNFAYAVLDYKGKVLKTKNLKNNITNMTKPETFKKEVVFFFKEFKKIKRKAGKRKIVLVFERFIPRSLHKGNVGEISNLLIGIAITTLKPNKVIPIVASTWKRKLKKEGVCLDVSKKDKISQHEKDAVNIGKFYLKHIKKEEDIF